MSGQTAEMLLLGVERHKRPLAEEGVFSRGRQIKMRSASSLSNKLNVHTGGEQRQQIRNNTSATYLVL